MVADKKIKEEALEFLKAHAECVLATASRAGTPEAATVLFAADDAFNLFFGTQQSYRKYNNLLENKRAAVVVGTSGKDPRTLQIEGAVRILREPVEIENAKGLFRQRNPAMMPFLGLPLVFLCLTPDWIRFLDETKGGTDNFVQIIP